MKRELTERQAEVLAYIKTYIKRFGYSPSIRGIAERFDVAHMAVYQHLKVIEDRGHIKRTRGVAMSIVVVE